MDWAEVDVQIPERPKGSYGDRQRYGTPLTTVEAWLTIFGVVDLEARSDGLYGTLRLGHMEGWCEFMAAMREHLARCYGSEKAFRIKVDAGTVGKETLIHAYERERPQREF